MRKVVIRTPFPSVESIAREFGISKARQRRLDEIVDSVLAESEANKRAQPRSSRTRNHARRKVKARLPR